MLTSLSVTPTIMASMMHARQSRLSSSSSSSSSTRALAAAALRRRSHRQRCRSTLTDRELEIKLAIAQSTDRLDLSDCQLSELPAAVFDLTSLHELSLAGNQLQQLPPEISRITGLQRLVLAGNLLTQLPQELFGLTTLEGLWVHGNLLQDMPEQLGQLTKLKQLSLAGNRLPSIPSSLTQLVHLQDLNLSGNILTSLPDNIGTWTELKKLSVHGNQLQQLPTQGWEQLQQLDEVCVQGNQLTALPDGIAKLGALTELSIADNRIQQLPADLSGLTALRKAHFYGNQLTQLPMGPDGLPALLLPSSAAGSNGGSNGGSSGLPLLSSLWLEANPLTDTAVLELLDLAAKITVATAAGSNGGSNGGSSSKGSKQPRIGLDDRQLSGGQVLEVWRQQQEAGCSIVRRGIIKGEGPGYFKLQLGPTAAWDGSSSSSSSSGSSSSSSSSSSERVLVVALGSAPGLPNWGGILAKVTAATDKPEEQCFDVLYVVDPYRSWYDGGEAGLMQQRYTSRLQQYTQQYKHVVMIGDSMGASAALLFSPLATKVMSFCPQVNLATSSIRPGQPADWQASLQDTLQSAVGSSKAAISVFTGTWQHDVDQAQLLTHHPHVQIKVHSVDSHRLALSLAGRNKLAPMIREAILSEVGLNSGNVRLSNLY